MTNSNSTTTAPTTQVKKGSSCIFLNPRIRTTYKDVIRLEADAQLILANNGDDYTLHLDDKEIIDITCIWYLGNAITDSDKIKAFTDHHKSLGIDLWEYLDEKLKMIINTRTVEELLEDFSPFKLK